jgi:hypothetical protein
MTKTILTLSLAVLCALSACSAPTTVTQYQAERAQYDAIGVEWWAYVEADPTLKPEDKELRWKNLVAWRARLDATGLALGLPVPEQVEAGR